MSLKQNVVANYLGQGWKALMGFVFFPVYIHYLGMESFALIGILALLQAWTTLLDAGMKPALAREMARFSAGRYSPEFIRDLLRSVVVVGLFAATLIVAVIWAASGWLAADWLTAQRMDAATVANAITWMGIVIAARFVEGIYVNSLIGLQRQVLLNLMSATLATLRGVGAIGVLAWVSPTIEAYFAWNGAVSILSIAVLSAVVYRTVPKGTRPAQFSWQALSHIRGFASGMLAISFLALLLTQIDKLLLSRLLTLEAFGYYALAAMVATALRLIPTPITSAIFPRFTELASHEGGEPALRALYHYSAQLISVLMGSAAIVLVAFAHPILLLWTGNATVAREAAPILAVLSLGTLLNGLLWVPYQLQLSYAWTALAIRSNLVAVAVLVPAIFWLAPHYGAIGVAWAWVALNVGYLIFTIHAMHHRLLVHEKYRWYLFDVALPVGAAAVVAALCHWIIPNNLGKAETLAVLVLTSLIVLATATLSATAVRERALGYILSMWGRPGGKIRQ